MPKAVVRTLPVQGSVQLKVMPLLSNLEAVIIFAGGIAIGYTLLSIRYAKEMAKNESEELN